jgi:hypothetical protein
MEALFPKPRFLFSSAVGRSLVNACSPVLSRIAHFENLNLSGSLNVDVDGHHRLAALLFVGDPESSMVVITHL